MPLDQDQLLNHLMAVVGIRAPITAAMVLQIVAELRSQGVFDEDAIARIKDTAIRVALQARPPHFQSPDHEHEIRQEFDRWFDDRQASPN